MKIDTCRDAHTQSLWSCRSLSLGSRRSDGVYHAGCLLRSVLGIETCGREAKERSGNAQRENASCSVSLTSSGAQEQERPLRTVPGWV